MSDEWIVDCRLMIALGLLIVDCRLMIVRIVDCRLSIDD